jgi:hypothetical protein
MKTIILALLAAASTLRLASAQIDVLDKSGMPAITGYLGYVTGAAGESPVPYSEYESRNEYDSLASYASGAWVGTLRRFNKLRAEAGAQPLVEDSALGRAALLLIEQILNQDWIGTSFPNGLSFDDILKQAGYAGDAGRVKAYFYLADGPWTKHRLYTAAPETDLQAMRSVVSPSFVSFGYAVIDLIPRDFTDHNRPYEGFDAGRVRASGYEVVLVSMDAPTAPSRALSDYWKRNQTHPFFKYDNVPTVDLRARRGQPIKGGIVVTPNQKVGVPIVHGRLPKGIHLSAATGKFVGKPRGSKGVYRFTVTVNFKMLSRSDVKLLPPGQNPNGVATVAGRITVR